MPAPRRRERGGRAGAAEVARRAIIPRPVGGPTVKVSVPYFSRAYVPDGSNRPQGPLRPVPLNRTLTATLEGAILPFGRGGLVGRYRDEVAAHLEEMKALRERGAQPGVSVYWDFENVGIPKAYGLPFREVMGRVLRWLAGVLDLPITRVEMVEITRYSKTPEQHFQSGRCDWHMTMRQLGAVVHRAWPRNSDAADVVLLDRIRGALEDMEKGAPRRVICLLSGDKGFAQMLEAAQSEGITVVTMASTAEARYYPGGSNFSVPIQTPSWMAIKRELMDRHLDPLRPEAEWTLEQGPPRWQGGVVALEPAEGEELDRRKLHDFLEPGTWEIKPTKYDGTWVRAGLRLNDTLTAALRRTLARTGMEGTRRGRLPPKAREAVERDLADLALGAGEHSAAAFWNFEDLRLLPVGPTQDEMLGRIVRWLSGMLGMPLQRVEVSRFVEPWERFGAHSLDWRYEMQKLGMVVHRVWPPRAEVTNTALTGSVAVLAKAAEARLKGGAQGIALPRIVCVLSEDLYFDDAMRAAQRAGISALWVGPEERGLYYPANSDVRVRIDVLAWATATKELAIAARDPFTPGAVTPDAPAAAWATPAVPVDLAWGRPAELQLDSTDLRQVLAALERERASIEA